MMNMDTAYFYLALSGALTILLWLPYILGRLYVVGLIGLMHGYPEGRPPTDKPLPLWAERSKRAHYNMVETMPAFIAVVVAASFLLKGNAEAIASVAWWTQVFFYSRVAHAVVYTFGTPFLRTPVYLVSWFAVLAIAAAIL
jgi:uncharacterized MAPEG superfamily protein